MSNFKKYMSIIQESGLLTKVPLLTFNKVSIKTFTELASNNIKEEFIEKIELEKEAAGFPDLGEMIVVIKPGVIKHENDKIIYCFIDLIKDKKEIIKNKIYFISKEFKNLNPFIDRTENKVRDLVKAKNKRMIDSKIKDICLKIK